MTWTRRRFIKAGILAAAGLSITDALWFEKFFIEVNEFFIGKATKTNYSLKLIQLSDLHLTSINGQLKKLARKINELQPELICITGDAVDKHENLFLLNDFLELIDKDLKKVAIVGNWEYWGNVNLKELNDIYKNNNCDLLINTSIQYQFNGKSISITGVDDFVAGKADIDRSLEKYMPGDFHIVLNHCPAYSDNIGYRLDKDINIDLILSGHTHGGQINFFGLIPFLPQGSGKYIKGWYNDEFKKMYVSKGIGTSILPARFGARAEISIFNL